MNKKIIQEIKKKYREKKSEIEKRIEYFKNNFKKEEDIFNELIFCLLTPQSKAKICWRCVENIVEKQKIKNGGEKQILCELKGVRFKYTKAKNIMLARKMFIKNNKIRIKEFLEKFNSVLDLREWLVKNIKGYGYKEASHFLRNIGFVEEITILDRHILKNLKRAGVIKDIPKTFTRKKYLEIENKMKKFAKKIKVPVYALDLIFWSNEAGEIFK
jgi:N-glycosylase/DNA lyase